VTQTDTVEEAATGQVDEVQEAQSGTVEEAAVAGAVVVPVEPRRRRTWWIPVLAVGIALAGSTGTYLGAGYVAHELRNEAIRDVAPLDEEAADAVGDLRAGRTLATAAAADGSAMAGVVVAGLGSADLATELGEASQEAADLVEDVEDPALPEPIVYDESSVRPAWTSILEMLATRARAADVAEERERVADDAEALAAAARAAEDARVAFYESATASAAEALAGNQHATYESRIEVQHGIDQTGTGWAQTRNSVGAYTALAAALDAMHASANAEAARRAAPEYAVHGGIEDFARSLAHGVNLDFRWAHVVNGLSSDEWYSGTAMYRYTDGGWATIELSHSIGWHWGEDVNAKAVVVHEVGHAQVVRPECEPLYSGPVFNGDDEMWATAWAIASGYDVPGSGIEAYGRPSDAQIAEAGKCI